MNRNPLPKPLKGIIPPLVTPLRGRDTLDTDGLERLVEHILSGGVHGLTLAGTTGEGPALSYRLRRQLVEQVCRQVGGRVPLLVVITDTSFSESLNQAYHAAEAGAHALVASAPFYYQLSQSQLIDYINTLADELPLPLFLYNFPAHTKIEFGLELLRRILEIPNVVGLKDSSGQMGYFHRAQSIISKRPEFSLLVGPDDLLAESLIFGAHGGISGGANLVPRVYTDLYEAATRGDYETVRQLHKTILQLEDALYSVPDSGPAVIKALKCSLWHIGICDKLMAEPFGQLSATEHEALRKALVKWNVLRETKSSEKGKVE